MMPVERAFEQLRRANPAPNPAALRRELQADADPTTAARSISMDTSTTTTSPAPPKRPRRWTPAVVAAGIVVLLGVPSLIWLAGDGVREPATPVEIAEAYMEALDVLDAGTARELLADDVVITNVVFTDVDEMAEAFEFLSVSHNRVSPFQCELRVEPEPDRDAVVSCNYLLNTRLQQIIDYPPIEATHTFTVSDGLITSMRDGFPYSQYSPNVYGPFVQWLETEHSGAYGSLYYTRGSTDYPLLTPEAIELHTEFLDLYEEWLNTRED